MNKKYTGHCACGQVTYGFETEPTFASDHGLKFADAAWKRGSPAPATE